MAGADFQAVVEDNRKITHYLLREDHPDGGPKAKFFKNFGFSENNWKTLLEALEEHPSVNEIADTRSNAWGVKFTVECKIRTPDQRDPCIRTVWMQRDPDGPAVFVTAYPRER